MFIVVKQNRYIRIFTNAGAGSAANSKTLRELGLRDSVLLRRMVKLGVVVRVPPDRYYLDPAPASAFQERRRKQVLAMLALAATFALICLALLAGR